VIVVACLAILVTDFSRRWGPPHLYANPRSRVMWAAVATVALALMLVAVID
jgi:hypothetical protein